MTERYGPDDPTIPSWEAPTGSPFRAPAARSEPAPVGAAPPPGMHAQGLPTYRSWQPGFMPLRPLTLGDFITLPMKAITFNKPVLVGGPLLCVIAILVAVTAAIILVVNDARDSISYGTRFDGLRPLTAVAIGVAGLIALLTTAAANALVAPGVARGVLGERITLGEAWAMARPRILRVLVVSFVFSVPSYLLSYLTSGSYSFDPYAPEPSAGETLLRLASFPLSVLVAVLTSVATAIVVLERSGIFKAIGRTFTLIRGNMWRFIGIGVVIYLIISLTVGIIGGIAMVPIIVVLLSSPSVQTAMIVAVIAVLVVVVLIAVVGYSYLGTLGTLIYIDLRIRKEGFDVDLARAAEARSAR